MNSLEYLEKNELQWPSRKCRRNFGEAKIQNGRQRPYWKWNLKINGHRNLCNTTFSTKCGMVSLFMTPFLYFSKSEKNEVQWPSRKCRRNFGEAKIEDGRRRPFWKCKSKTNGHRNPCNATFPTKRGMESSFLASFLYFDKSKSKFKIAANCQIQFLLLLMLFYSLCDIAMRAISHSLLNSHEKVISSNICLFCVVILLIYP